MLARNAIFAGGEGTRRARVRKTWRSANLRDVRTTVRRREGFAPSGFPDFTSACLGEIALSTRSEKYKSRWKNERGGSGTRSKINESLRCDGLSFRFSRKIGECLAASKIIFPTPPRNWRSRAFKIHIHIPYLAPRLIARADRARRYLVPRIERPNN